VLSEGSSWVFVLYGCIVPHYLWYPCHSERPIRISTTVVQLVSVTKYGLSPSSTRSHTLHHTQRISRAAALGEIVTRETRAISSMRFSIRATEVGPVGQRHGASVSGSGARGI
jgi:hypothetical protein